MDHLERLSALSAGATFYRADLHIHSHGASVDVPDGQMTPEQIASTARAEGLAIIALTDHNSIAGVARALTAASGAPQLFVVPGVELSTPDGHLLAYLPDLPRLEDFFGKLSIASPGTRESRCQTALHDCLKLLEVRGGFGILAHVEATNGFESQVPRPTPHKQDILAHPALLGFEVSTSESPILYDSGDGDADRVRLATARRLALSQGQRQHLARVLFSDAHSLVGLGHNARGERRVTRLKMDSPSFEGVRVALSEPETRVRLEDDVPPSVPFVRGVLLSGGFLDSQDIHFSRNLNCIIGSRGAGKSTALEAARSLATNPGDNELVDSEAWPDTLTAVWTDASGTDHVIQRVKEGRSTNLADPQFGPIDFPIESFGQGDMADVCRRARSDPAALLQYLDSFVQFDDFLDTETATLDALRENAAELLKAAEMIGREPGYRSLLRGAQQQLNALKAAKGKELIELEQQLARAKSLREGIEEFLREIERSAKSPLPADIKDRFEGMTDPKNLPQGMPHFKSLVASAATFEVAARAASTELSSKARAFADGARKILEDWARDEAPILTSIATKRDELRKSGIQLDLTYIKKLTADEATHTKNLETIGQWKTRQKSLQLNRLSLLKELTAVREAVHMRREAFAALANRELTTAVGGLRIVLRFREQALSREAESIIQTAMGWRTSQVPRALILVETLSLPGLLKAITTKNRTTIEQVALPDHSTPFRGPDAREIIEKLSSPETLYNLQHCVVTDSPVITVARAAPAQGSTKAEIVRPFSRLSLGQQQSVLLAIMLTGRSTAPLIIDQPEDHLDGEFIAHSLVPIIRRAKEQRQIILVTHNANLAVLTDAEQILALKGTNDRGVIMARGSVDSPDVRKFILEILEGSEQAFRRRADLYGLPIK